MKLKASHPTYGNVEAEIVYVDGRDAIAFTFIVDGKLKKIFTNTAWDSESVQERFHELTFGALCGSVEAYIEFAAGRLDLEELGIEVCESSPLEH